MQPEPELSWAVSSLADSLDRRLGSPDCSRPRICELGGEGFLKMPWFGDDEQQWHPAFRAVLYLLGLGWCFMGVALSADVFMGSIEHITSQRARKYDPRTKTFRTVQVWNPTVANLTLMALGSSAPEILLSAIELLGNDFYSGDLGPSTIVGSAAFNLFAIIAVCVCAIPSPEVRYIKEVPVYCVTAFCSVFAYVWLVVVLLGWSPHVVEPAEGVMTLLFFPVLVVLAYLADRGYLTSPRPSEEDHGEAPRVVGVDMSMEELAGLEHQVRASQGGHLTEEEVAQIINCECRETASRAKHRVSAIRSLTAGKRVTVSRSSTLHSGISQLTGPHGSKASKVVPIFEEETAQDNYCVMEFDCKKYAVLEHAGFRRCVITRAGCLESAASVCYATRQGTAKAGSDYTHTEGKLTFGPGETAKDFTVTIANDTAFEDDEEFYVDLSDPQVEGKDNTAEIGVNHTVIVVIIDDDSPGLVSFATDEMRVQEGEQDKQVDVVVKREKGSTGRISMQYCTEDATAHAGVDYIEESGELVFEQGETEKAIRVTVRSRGRYKRQDTFRVVLTDLSGGAAFDKASDGGEESCIMTVIIEGDTHGKERVERIMSSMCHSWEQEKIGHTSYVEQLREAVLVNGGSDEDAGAPGVQDYLLHFITLPWKLLCALVPPTDYCNGWLCFCCSLLLIGAITALIADLASLFGCVLTIPDEVTAITFVALGTSLPDTFASRAAALADPFADASVGNVTGSNCVNVFLGLGIPWMIGSLYWAMKGRDGEWDARYLYDSDIAPGFRETGAFIVKAGTLAFSVVVFSCLALVCLAILYARRVRYGGELGGPRVPAAITSAVLVGLWLIYVALSSWYALANNAGC